MELHSGIGGRTKKICLSCVELLLHGEVEALLSSATNYDLINIDLGSWPTRPVTQGTLVLV